MTLKGAGKLKRKMSQMTPELTKRLSKTLAVGANDLRNDAIKSMRSSPPDGSRTYKRRTVKYSASSPGRPPRVDTGNLVNSIFANGSGLKYRVGTGVPYGKYLEFGTSNMKSRPWLFPALLRIEPKVKAEIKKNLKEGLRKVAR